MTRLGTHPLLLLGLGDELFVLRHQLLHLLHQLLFTLLLHLLTLPLHLRLSAGNRLTHRLALLLLHLCSELKGHRQTGNAGFLPEALKRFKPQQPPDFNKPSPEPLGPPAPSPSCCRPSSSP